MSYHPDRQALERFARGDVFRHEARQIVEHLRSGCRSCQRELDGLLPVADDPLAEVPMAPEQPAERPAQRVSEWLERGWPRVDLARLRAQLARVRRDREGAPARVEELLALPPRERQAALRSEPRYANPAVCDRLIEASFEAGFDDPARAVALAELAIELSDRIDAAVYGRALALDVKARAWAYLGNARRLNSDRRGAEEALALAQSLSSEGSGDPLEQARILDLKASLAADRGRFEEAIELLDMVIDIYGEIRESHRLGRALLSKGVVVGNQGDPAAGAALIRESLAHLDRESEPRLLLWASHNLAWFTDEAGRPAEAEAELASFAHLYDDFPDAAAQARRLWLAGRIAAGLGRAAEAESALREVQRRFAEAGQAYDAAVVTMDLAALLLELGRNREVAALAAETFPVLVAQDVHHHALAALVAFTHAVERDCATPKLARDIANFLVRASRNPRLQFHARG
jgi:tetratricopeptide (TPR) repeat protein